MRNFIIDELIKIENEAQKITQNADNKQDNIDSIINNRCFQIEEFYKKEFNKSLEKFVYDENKNLEVRIQEVRNKFSLKLNKMLNNINTNKIKWEDEILDKILSE